jgi:hypothetical protein
MLVPAPWLAAFGKAKPLKIGTLQPLSGAAAAGGKTSLVGVQMAVDRINKAGGVNGRPIELIIADDESKPEVGRRKIEKLLVGDRIDAHQGGLLSNVCLACMPVFEEHLQVRLARPPSVGTPVKNDSVGEAHRIENARRQPAQRRCKPAEMVIPSLPLLTLSVLSKPTFRGAAELSDVHLWPKAGIATRLRNVRFWR